MIAAGTRGRWIPWIFVLGMLIVVAVNAVLITAAFRSFPGLVVQRPYDRGIAYSEELRRGQAQAALGWTVTPAYANGRFVVSISASDGGPVPGLDVKASLSRPLEAMAPIEIALVRDGGDHVALVDFPKRGQWEIRIVASGAAGDYRGSYRMVVP